MKIFKLTILIIAVISLSCKEKKTEPVQQTQNPSTTVAAVQHYICANNCENSGGDAAGVCPTCNTPYTHNQAFHNKNFLQGGPLDVPKFDASKNTSSKPATPSPAQNKFGAFHYTCSNGCNGGSGSATQCTTCGSKLVHNQAYHAN
jgi:hypothetical protein